MPVWNRNGNIQETVDLVMYNPNCSGQNMAGDSLVKNFLKLTRQFSRHTPPPTTHTHTNTHTLIVGNYNGWRSKPPSWPRKVYFSRVINHFFLGWGMPGWSSYITIPIAAHDLTYLFHSHNPFLLYIFLKKVSYSIIKYRNALDFLWKA